MNVALFGGSFDPFHIGHEAIISNLQSTLDFEKLFLIPTYLNPFKESSHFNAQNRLEFLHCMYDNNPNISIESYEVDLQRKVPTIETIEYLSSKYDLDTIYLVIGADNFINIKKWNSFEKLQSMVTFVVVSRNGYEINSEIPYIPLLVDVTISSTSLRKSLDLSYIPQKLHKRILELWKKE